MAFTLRETLRSGLSRVRSRNGAILIGTFALISLFQGGFVWIISAMYVPLGSNALASTPAGPTPGTALPSFVAVPAVLLASVTGGIFTIPVQIVAIRTMVSRHTDRIPEEFIFHNMGWATLHSLLGSWFVSILVGVTGLVCLLPGMLILFAVMDAPTQSWMLGSWLGNSGIGLFVLILLLPSAFLGVSLLFVGQEIAVKDRNLIQAIVGSWRQCRGHRVRLLLLSLVPTLIQTGVLMLVFVRLDQVWAQSLIFVETAIVQMTILAIMARAYVAVHNDTVIPIAGASRRED
ncbi:hypothetical protein [Halocatena marina]|nr:hypothetical protein [Halocatena marina]